MNLIEITYNARKHTTLFLIFGILLISSLLALSPKDVHGETLGAPGCTPDKPYNCTMSRRKFDELTNQWCGLANSDKQEECKLAFLDFVYRKPTDLKKMAGFTIPQFCAPRFDGGRTPADEARIPDGCYVLPKKGTEFYNALKQIIEDCGTVDDQDVACVRQIQQQFLSDYKSGWADPPDTGGSSTGTGGAINTDNGGAKTTFINRVSSYIKWFTLGLGILAVFGLIISGIQYAAAQDNPQAVAGAKTRIYNIVIGIVIYAFMFGLLQWLIPGGVFSL